MSGTGCSVLRISSAASRSACQVAAPMARPTVAAMSSAAVKKSGIPRPRRGPPAPAPASSVPSAGPVGPGSGILTVSWVSVAIVIERRRRIVLTVLVAVGERPEARGVQRQVDVGGARRAHQRRHLALSRALVPDVHGVPAGGPLGGAEPAGGG